jgi:hypothetical protein
VARLFNADPETGIWWGTPAYLSLTFGPSMAEGTARGAMSGLESKGMIRSFATPGRRGNHPVLIHGYEPSAGRYRGLRLDAQATTDWRNPVYENRGTGSAGGGDSSGD